MPFNQMQLEALGGPLNRAHVKSRAQAGRSLSYIEGWHAIAEANRIFGFGGWDRETIELRECGEPRQVDGKWRVAFMCRVRITVRPPNDESRVLRDDAIIRDGTGYGSGIDKDLGQAFESAIKEAETDAMKRGLMTFGNPFGLALYDKDQANVVDVREPDPREEAAGRFIADCERVIDAETDRATLIAWWNGDDRKAAFKRYDLTQDEGSALAARVKARAEALADGGRAAA